MEPTENTHARNFSTLVVHCKRAPYDVYIGRGRGGKWGNPFTHLQIHATQAQYQVATVAESVRKHREWFLSQPALVEAAKLELKGKILGCWCKVKGHEPCHGDVLADVANSDQYPDFGWR